MEADQYDNLAQPDPICPTPCQAAVTAALKAAMDKRSIELLEAAIPKATGYGIDTTEAKEALKVSEGSCRVRGMVRLGS